MVTKIFIKYFYEKEKHPPCNKCWYYSDHVPFYQKLRKVKYCLGKDLQTDKCKIQITK